MKIIKYFKINSILELMLGISLAAMILMSGFVWIVTGNIVNSYEAKEFLANAGNIPGNTLHIFLFTAISGICLICTFIIRNCKTKSKIIVVTLIFDFILELVCIVLLNFNYNGILLWTFANALIYLKRNRYIPFVVILAVLSYLLTTHELVKLITNIYMIFHLI